MSDGVVLGTVVRAEMCRGELLLIAYPPGQATNGVTLGWFGPDGSLHISSVCGPEWPQGIQFDEDGYIRIYRE
jgi:hypothetical protein